MGILHLGSATEIRYRLKSLENTKVAKVIHDLDSINNPDSTSDITIIADED